MSITMRSFIRTFMIFIVAILFTGACASTPSTTAVTPPTVTSIVPIPLPTFTATVTAQPSTWIASEPLSTATTVPLPDSEIPVFPGVQEVVRNFPLLTTEQRRTTLYYEVSASISEIESFYTEELARNGWEWVYTDVDESLSMEFPLSALLMEFKKGQHKLGISVLRYFSDDSIVLAGIDISGGQLYENFYSGISGGLDLMGPYESSEEPDAMHFSSILLEFSHPTDWLANDQLMRIFETDLGINYYPNEGICSIHMDICFVNFSVSTGFHFENPISIRAHPELANMTLEEANQLRWDELNANASAPEQRYRYPEDLAQENTLETIEVRTLTLGDDTPAIQRIYRWKQDDVDEFIIGTYTLFVSGDTLVEFHADFTSESWREMREIIEQVIASMRVTTQQ